MSKNFEKEKTSIELIEIPAACVTQLFFDVHCLLGMHEQLIQMYEVESMLKKHHKAYLHIREQADEMCRAHKALMSEIVDHYQNPAKYKDETLLFHDMLKKLDEECGEETVYPTAGEIYKKRKELQEEDSNPDKTSEKAEAVEETDGESVMVLLSADNLQWMKDDTIALLMVIDHLVEVIRKDAGNGLFTKESMEMMAKEALEISDEVMEHWKKAILGDESCKVI